MGALGRRSTHAESDYLRQGGGKKKQLSTKDLKTLQERTFYAKEKKSLAYALGIMNSILHGIDVPNIVRTNTLEENIADVQPKDQFDIIHNTRDGIRRKYGRGGVEIMEYLHQIGKRMGCEAFQW